MIKIKDTAPAKEKKGGNYDSNTPVKSAKKIKNAPLDPRSVINKAGSVEALELGRDVAHMLSVTKMLFVKMGLALG